MPVASRFLAASQDRVSLGRSEDTSQCPHRARSGRSPPSALRQKATLTEAPATHRAVIRISCHEVGGPDGIWIGRDRFGLVPLVYSLLATVRHRHDDDLAEACTCTSDNIECGDLGRRWVPRLSALSATALRAGKGLGPTRYSRPKTRPLQDLQSRKRSTSQHRPPSFSIPSAAGGFPLTAPGA